MRSHRNVLCSVVCFVYAVGIWKVRRRMGNCCGAEKPAKGQVREASNLSRKRSQREAAWSSTGTVALRDSNLKVYKKSKQRRFSCMTIKSLHCRRCHKQLCQ